MAVNVGRGDLETVPGRFGWNGGSGTSGYTDPAEPIGLLLTGRAPASPAPPPICRDFWTGAYQAIDG